MLLAASVDRRERSPMHAYTWYIWRKAPRSGPSLKVRVGKDDCPPMRVTASEDLELRYVSADRRMRGTINCLIIALTLAAAAGPALAASEYPPGLFENSPVVPSGPPDAAGPSEPPGTDGPIGPESDAVPPDDYCAGVELRSFRTPEEVRQAHARCDAERR